jgi:hypothetical protein
MKTMNKQSDFSRRSLIAGARTIGLLAASASLLPSRAVQGIVELGPLAAPTAAKGNHLSEHVKRYYRSTLV